MWQPERFSVPAHAVRAEMEVKGSLFVATLDRVRDEEGARAFIAAVGERYYDASHNAWAFRITGGPQALIGSSDDGEPGGTAGRPMLAVLTGAELCQVAVVGTRYFGGTKLGTGGLVRAYGGVVRQALAGLSAREIVLHSIVTITVPYGAYGQFRYELPRHRVRILDEAFAGDVRLTLGIPHAQLESIGALLQGLSNGGIELDGESLEKRYLPADENAET